MGIEQYVKSYIDTDIVFTGKTRMENKGGGGALICNVSIECGNERYRLGDYIHFFQDDDFDLQASEGHVVTMDIIATIEAIRYNTQTENIKLKLNDVYELQFDSLVNRKRYIPAHSPFLQVVSLERIKQPRKLTKTNYEQMIRG